MPAPYPEYADLYERARLEAPRFVDPSWLARVERVSRARGRDWCTAVLGASFGWVRSLTVPQCQLLLLADEADLDPPLPPQVLAEREAAQRRRDALDEAHQQLQERDAAAWRAALADCAVEVRVHVNATGRRTGTGLAAGPLRHAVPVADAWSGPSTSRRLHRAGRPVCETPDRARPRTLGPQVDAPATCTRCLGWLPKLLPADA